MVVTVACHGQPCTAKQYAGEDNKDVGQPYSEEWKFWKFVAEIGGEKGQLLPAQQAVKRTLWFVDPFAVRMWENLCHIAVGSRCYKNACNRV